MAAGLLKHLRLHPDLVLPEVVLRVVGGDVGII